MKPVVVTDANFKSEVLDAETPVLIDFWAEWCAPCRMIVPVLEDIAKEYHGKLKVAKLDVDSNPATSMAYDIRALPTLLIFKDGKVVEQIVGALPKRNLVDKVMRHVA